MLAISTGVFEQLDRSLCDAFVQTCVVCEQGASCERAAHVAQGEAKGTGAHESVCTVQRPRCGWCAQQAESSVRVGCGERPPHMKQRDVREVEALGSLSNQTRLWCQRGALKVWSTARG